MIVVQDGRNQILGMSELNSLLLVLRVDHFCSEFVQNKCAQSFFERPLYVGVRTTAMYALLQLLKKRSSGIGFR
jgi:hypothetical protein